MSETSSNTSGGIGFFGLFTIVLAVLKLTGLAKLSWFWVFAPVLGGIAITGLLIIFVALMTILTEVLK
jgi:hypothetical protein